MDFPSEFFPMKMVKGGQLHVGLLEGAEIIDMQLRVAPLLPHAISLAHALLIRPSGAQMSSTRRLTLGTCEISMPRL